MKWRPNAPAEIKGERYVLAGIPTNLKPLFQFAYSQGARIHSNSWGGGDPGAYDDQCRQFDRFVWDNKDFCFVIAAGNDGTDTDGDGDDQPDERDLAGHRQELRDRGRLREPSARVRRADLRRLVARRLSGAPFDDDPMSNDDEQVVAFSSRGPTG